MIQRQILKRNYTELTGCLHIHSEYSFDSQTPVQEILEAAHKCKLDYLGINDHLSDKIYDDPIWKNEDKMFCLPGSEINDPQNNNHLLVYNCQEIKKNCEAEEYVSYYLKQGAITFAAHPFERRATTKLRKYIWTDPGLDEFTGLEIWNALSNWVSKIRPSLNGLVWVLLAKNFIRRPSRAAIRWWDRMNLEGKKRSAIGSVDAHGLIVKKFGIKFTLLKHRFMFKSVRTNVLIPEGRELNNDSILRALAEGRSYIVNYHRGIPYNFFAGINRHNEAGVSFGEEIQFREGLRFYFRLPKIARVKCYCDGKMIGQQVIEKGNFEVKTPGNYRLEILLNRKGWIYTNNIYVQ